MAEDRAWPVNDHPGAPRGRTLEVGRDQDQHRCKDGGKAPERQQRTEFLDRMRILFPLPADLEDVWKDFRARFPHYIGLKMRDRVGKFLLEESDMWEEAAERAKAPRKKKRDGAEPPSFAAFVRKWHGKMGAPSGSKRM